MESKDARLFAAPIGNGPDLLPCAAACDVTLWTAAWAGSCDQARRRRGEPPRGRGVRVFPARARVRDGVGDPLTGRPRRARLGPDPWRERRRGRPHAPDALATASAGPQAPGWDGRRGRVTSRRSTP